MGRARFLIDLDFLAELLNMPQDMKVEGTKTVVDFQDASSSGIEALEVTVSSPQLRSVPDDVDPPLMVPKLERRAPSIEWFAVMNPGAPADHTERSRSLGPGRRVAQ